VVAELVGANDDFSVGFRSGASRARTGDLVSATHALSQLSYGPKGIFVRPVYRRSLCIPGRRNSEMEGRPAGYLLCWQKVNPIQRLAISRDGVDFFGGVLAADRSSTRQSVPNEIDADDSPLHASPFALHAENPITEIEGEVVSNMLADGLEDLDPELRRLQGNRHLGDVALVVGIQHPAILPGASSPSAP
jgi:hypothetical protein